MENPIKAEHAKDVMHPIFFPLDNKELRKLLLLGCTFLLIIYSYTITNLQDTYLLLNITDPIALSLFKLYGITPSIIIFTFLYSRLDITTERDMRFNAIMIYFSIFFTLAAVWFLLNLEALQLTNITNKITTEFPKLFGLWTVTHYWSLSFFHTKIWGLFTTSTLLETMDLAEKFSIIRGVGSSFEILFVGL